MEQGAQEKPKRSNKKPGVRRERQPNQKSKKIVAVVEEDIRISIKQQIEMFINDETQTKYDFPLSFTNVERAFVHTCAPEFGLISKSQGVGNKRVLSLYKREMKAFSNENTTFLLTDSSRGMIFKLLKEIPFLNNEMYQLQGYTGKSFKNFRVTSNFPLSNVLTVPPYSINENVRQDRIKLPIYAHRNEIIEAINDNEIILISGSTGSGKTTQVPQYIMEECNKKQEVCRIICTQPRRLSAISVAERVSDERGESIGETVGYQIRLESMLGPSSNLIYCTNGILLRSLIGSESSNSKSLLNEVTHIIVDEVHERDKLCDFLLISLKEKKLSDSKTFKLILMSATLDTFTFQNYFNMCPVIYIPGTSFEVKMKYLDEVLYEINYKNRNSELFEQEDYNNVAGTLSNLNLSDEQKKNQTIEEKIKNDINNLFIEIWENSFSDAFDILLELIKFQMLSVDYICDQTNMSGLMIAATKGNAVVTEALLNLGANPFITGPDNKTALELSKIFNNVECTELIERVIAERQLNNPNNTTARYKYLLDKYLAQTNEIDVDHNLLFETIKYIHAKMPPGAILVFLPGYDDILQQNDLLVLNEIPRDAKIFLLHSNMQTSDQKNVFKRSSCRKIILATNIAETSITIADVVYVIDTGKVKQKSFDSITATSSLQTIWISQACALQRAGRAGRTQNGICYRLYSSTRYDNMDKYTIAEMLRSSLTEICLHAKLLTNGSSIMEFLLKAIEPPSAQNVKQSINNLITIDALDHKENITELGYFLSDLPIDVGLGKILIYGILFKCLDPVLTIISCLSMNDPFILPSSSDERYSAITIKKELSENSLSDHFTMLKVFQKWNESQSNRQDHDFCTRHFINPGTMNLITGLRKQLLQHLRSCNFIKSNGAGSLRDLNNNSKNWAMVKACLAAGLYPSICRIDKSDVKIKSRLNEKVDFHQSSVLFTKSVNEKNRFLEESLSEWILFQEKTRAGRITLIKPNTIVTPITIALFCGQSVMQDTNLLPVGMYMDSDEYEANAKNSDLLDPEDNVTKFVIDDWISFLLKDETAHFVFQLRRKINYILVKLLRNSDKFYRSEDAGIVIQTVANVLSQEDLAYKMPEHDGIDTIPKSGNIGLPVASNISKAKAYQPQIRYNNNPSTRNQSRMSGDKYQTTESVEPVTNNQPRRSTSNDDRKYFIVHSQSIEDILESVKGITVDWKFSVASFNYLSLLAKSNRNLKVIVFFLVKPRSLFFGAAKFMITEADEIILYMLSEKRISFNDMSRMASRNNIPRKLHEFRDSEEIPQSIGEIVYDLFN